MRIVIAGVIASALLNAVALAVGRGYFIHWFAVMVLALWVGLPALAIATGAYLLGQRFVFARRLARVAALAAVVSVSTLVSLIPGHVVANRDIAAAKEYCGSRFGFTFGNPRGIMNFISYGSETRQWREWH